MKKILLSFSIASLFVSSVYAQPNPTIPVSNCENRCAKLSESCNKRCNHPDNPGLTHNCLFNCGNQSTQCYAHCQIDVQHCAGEFSTCSRNAQSPAEKQACIAAYHQCKGTGK